MVVHSGASFPDFALTLPATPNYHTDMRSECFRITLRLVLSAALCVGLATILPSAAVSQTAAPSVPTAPFPDDLLAPPKPKAPEVSRKEVMADLFERLKKAPDSESAELVAEAIDAIWLKSGSDTVDLLMNRAAVLVREENLDLALDILDSVVEIAPDYPEGWNRRATIFFLKRDFRRSLDDLRNVLALEPRHFKAINGLGLIMQELGDKEAALKAFRKVLQVYPQSSDARRIEEELAREVEGQGI